MEKSKITWHQMGNFGNTCFQYIFTNMLAEKYNFEYITNEKILNFGSYPNCKEIYDAVFNFKNIQNVDEDKCHIISDENLQEFFKNINNKGDFKEKDFIVHGYFQCYDFYKDYNFKKLFTFDDSKFLNVSDNDLLVNLRIGSDWKSNKWLLYPEYIVKKLNEIDFNNLVILTDCHDEEYLTIFKKFNPKIICNHFNKPLEDLYTLMSYKKLLITNSTFSYWGAALGKSEEIYMPCRYQIKDNYMGYIPGKEEKSFFYDVSYHNDKNNS